MRRVKAGWRVALTTALLLALGLGLSEQADARNRAKWISAWGFSQQGLAPETVTNATVRMIARPTISGSAVRVVLQNTFGLEASRLARPTWASGLTWPSWFRDQTVS